MRWAFSSQPMPSDLPSIPASDFQPTHTILCQALLHGIDLRELALEAFHQQLMVFGTPGGPNFI
jgi:hypothetical protein